VDANAWHGAKALGKIRDTEGTAHYTLEEAENIISALVDHVDAQLAFALAFFLGLRPSEIAGLQWGDVDGSYLHIRRAYVRGEVGPTKTPESVAALPIIQPIAGLLKDLKSRGLLEKTPVIWGGEFGRTPMSEKGDGRDHNPYGFTMWMAGGGVKGGITHGSTDELGLYAIENKAHIHDIHATVLALLGLDHEALTFEHNGRDERLTITSGKVIKDIIA
jgi:integrase